MSYSFPRSAAVIKVLDDLENFEIDHQQYWDDAEPQGWYDSMLTGKVKSLLAFCRSLAWSDLVATLEGLLPIQCDAPEALEQLQSFVIPEARHLLSKKPEGTATMSRFSERHGYEPDEPEVKIRNDAPEELRHVVVSIAYEAGLSVKATRTVVCRLLRKREDSDNWTDFPNVDTEVRRHVESIEWYRVYDVIEALHDALSVNEEKVEKFDQEMNKYFRDTGIGWQLVDGKIETRGSEAFEQSVTEATTALASSGRTTAANEIHQALADLSRRPKPDITGAIQHLISNLPQVAHAMSYLPCTVGSSHSGANPWPSTRLNSSTACRSPSSSPALAPKRNALKRSSARAGRMGFDARAALAGITTLSGTVPASCSSATPAGFKRR